MIKTFYFDLGNVLVFFDLERMFSQIAHISGLESSEVKKLIYQTELCEKWTDRVSRLPLRTTK